MDSQPSSARTNPWLVFVLPFVVYMAVGSFEPGPPKPADQPQASSWLDLGIQYQHYPLIYSVKIALTVAAMIFVWPGYRQFPLRVSPLAIAIGVAGVVAWIALAKVQQPLNAKLDMFARPAFNPRDHLPPAWAYTFLAIRLFGLALVVPIIEEFFLRGFLMRFVMAADWWKVPFGTATSTALVIGTVFPMLSHPGELVAAAVWFSAVTWLMLRTRNVWDCVAAHAITNALMGAFVIWSGNWWLM
jgi:CAAX prenyl protease-like protein